MEQWFEVGRDWESGSGTGSKEKLVEEEKFPKEGLTLAT